MWFREFQGAFPVELMDTLSPEEKYYLAVGLLISQGLPIVYQSQANVQKHTKTL